MNVFNIFCGEKSNLEENRCEVQSPLIKRDPSGKRREETPSRKKISSMQVVDFKTRSTASQRSNRLSVTDLLAQVEQQSAMFSNMFPLIDKQKYRVRQASSETDSEDVFELRKNIEHSKERLASQSFEQDRVNLNNRRYTAICHEGGATSSFTGKEDVFPPVETPLIVTNSFQPPDDPSRQQSTAWFGVHIEILAAENKLKIGVQRFEVEDLVKDHKRRVARVCLMPGSRQSQKVNVTLASSKLQNQHCAYFTGTGGSDLFDKEVHVGIYIKQGLFKKDKLILEFTVPIQNMNLEEPQMIWKRC